MLRLINNKRIDLTQEEFNLYEQLCKTYSRDHFDGKDLFIDLFETDETGMIIFLKPPSSTFSMEIVIFLQNIMTHQHLRKIYKEHDMALAELEKSKNELKNLLNELRKASSESAK